MSTDRVIETLWEELTRRYPEGVVIHSTAEGGACCHPGGSPDVEYRAENVEGALRKAIEAKVSSL